MLDTRDQREGRRFAETNWALQELGKQIRYDRQIDLSLRKLGDDASAVIAVCAATIVIVSMPATLIGRTVRSRVILVNPRMRGRVG